jgi:chitinase
MSCHSSGHAGRRCLIYFLAGSLALAASARAEIWRTGYYPGWEQPGLPAAQLDFAVLTHVIHFAATPNANGTLNSSANGLTLAYSADLISQAHAAGRKVLICVGGGGTQAGFQGAASSGNRAAFINNVVNLMSSRGYDGVDIDWEPVPTTDAESFTNLIYGLRAALNGFPQPKLLTVAAAAYPPYGDSPTAHYQMFAALQGQFDQINVMTYDMAGPYPGWVTWFNSPLFDGGYHFPSSGGLVPSIDVAIDNFLNQGVAANRLGIGIAFYGYAWTGASGAPTGGVVLPRQSWTVAPTMTAYRYRTIMNTYYQSNRYHWDASAQAAYLSITNANPVNNIYLSYDDERTCQAKVSYIRNRRLGGVMIWALGQDYQSGQPEPLLQAVKQALTTPGWVTLQRPDQEINLGFSSLPLGSYRVQWSSNLTDASWNTLTVTNVSGPGGWLEIPDSTAALQPQRFYRVQTPP